MPDLEKNEKFLIIGEPFCGGRCFNGVKRLKESFTSCVNDCDNDWFIIRRGVTATAIPRLHFIPLHITNSGGCTLIIVQPPLAVANPGLEPGFPP